MGFVDLIAFGSSPHINRLEVPQWINSADVTLCGPGEGGRVHDLS